MAQLIYIELPPNPKEIHVFIHTEKLFSNVSPIKPRCELCGLGLDHYIHNVVVFEEKNNEMD